MFINYEHGNNVYNVTIERRDNHYFVMYDNTEYRVKAEEIKPGYLKIKIGDRFIKSVITEGENEKYVFVLFTDFNNFEIVAKVNIKKAAVVFVNLVDDTQKLVYILNFKKHFGTQRFVVTLDNANLKDTFHSAGVSYVLSKNEIAAKMVASYIFEPDVAEYNADLLASSKNENDFDIQEYRVTAKNPFSGKTYGQAFFHIKKEYNSILIGLSIKIDNHRQLLKNPSDNTIINQGDYLILITNGRSEKLEHNFRKN